MYYALGGGENIAAVTLSCFSLLLEIISDAEADDARSSSKWLQRNSAFTSLISLWTSSSSVILKNTDVSQFFSIILTIVGVDRKRTNSISTNLTADFIRANVM